MDENELEGFHLRCVADDLGECIIWIGLHTTHGYGLWQKRGAHRVAYEHWIGPIPPGLVIDHLCRMRPCVNPYHLRAVTSRENTLAPGSLASAAERSTVRQPGRLVPYLASVAC